MKEDKKEVIDDECCDLQLETKGNELVLMTFNDDRDDICCIKDEDSAPDICREVVLNKPQAMRYLESSDELRNLAAKYGAMILKYVQLN